MSGDLSMSRRKKGRRKGGATKGSQPGRPPRARDQVRFSVITLPHAGADGPSLHSEIRLCKAALLYGDRVTLHSPNAALLLGGEALAHADPRDRVLLTLLLVGSLEGGAPGDRLMWEELLALHGRRNRTREELMLLMRLQGLVDKEWEGISERLVEMARAAGADELRPAVEAGLLRVDPLYPGAGDYSVEQMFDVLTERLGRLLSAGAAYPLFDDGVGGLVRAGLKEGLFEVRPRGKRRARHAGMAAGLLDHLPAFPAARMNEILDIRTELGPPLRRFRQAVVRLSREAALEAYDSDFALHVEDVWIEEVEPALEEIREAVKRRPSLAELARAALGNASFGVVVSDLAELPTIVGMTAGLGVGAAADVLVARRRSKREVQRADFYFLYDLGERLA